MPQFVPSDRETVMEYFEDSDAVHEVGKIEPDMVVVVHKADYEANIWNAWGSFPKAFGWAVTAFQPDCSGDVLYLAPIREVDAE